MEGVAPIRGTLPLNEMKQRVSESFLGMIAAAAGLAVLDWKSDYDGRDTTLSSDAEYQSRIGIKLDVQLKCTGTPVFASQVLTHKLRRDRYEKLRHEKRFEVSMLAVMVVPSNPEDWLELEEERIFSKSTMYFSLTNEWPLIGSGQESKVVHLPRTNILTPDTLNSAMEIAASKDVFSW